MIVLGIDPGLSGGIALIESGDCPRVILATGIPVFGQDAKRRVDVPRVLALLQPHKIAAGFIERAQAFAKQGASSGFIYGRAVGQLEACIMGMGLPFNVCEASAWKKTHGLIRPKEVDPDIWKKVVKKRSIERAKFLFPDSHGLFPRQGDHGIAEAILIASHGSAVLQPQARSYSPRSKKASTTQPDLLDVETDSV